MGGTNGIAVVFNQSAEINTQIPHCALIAPTDHPLSTTVSIGWSVGAKAWWIEDGIYKMKI